MTTISAVLEQNFRSKWSVLAALGAGCLVGMSGILLVQRLSLRVEQVSSQSLSRELASLHSTLRELQQEIQRIKQPTLKPAIRNVTFSDVDISLEEKELMQRSSSYSTTTTSTEYFSAISSDDDEDFYDIQTDTDLEDESGEAVRSRTAELCQDVQRIREQRELNQFFSTLDELMEGDACQQKRALEMLRRREESLSENCDFIWRLCKSMYLSAVALGQEGDTEGRKDLIFRAVDYGARAIAIDESSSEAHKWFAIVIGSRGEYVGIKEKIEDGYEFKKHIDRAAELAPQDHTVKHLLGRFCYEVAELSWLERKMAATLFADPPHSTMEEARDHFLAAEELKPDGWKENRQYLAKCFISLKDYKTALEWLDKANQLPVNNPDDQQAQNDIEEMLKLYKSYR